MHERDRVRPTELVQEETGCILFDTNILGTKGPRVMHVFVPKPATDGQPSVPTLGVDRGKKSHDLPAPALGLILAICRSWEQVLCPGLVQRAISGAAEGEVVALQSVAPRWNEALGAYCLNFGGRVTLPSVKNFQLCTFSGQYVCWLRHKPKSINLPEHSGSMTCIVVCSSR